MTSHKIKPHFLLFLLSLGIPVTANSHDIKFNNGNGEDYSRAASLKGDVRKIQSLTKDLWPRAKKGIVYRADKNQVTITEKEKYLVIRTNNLPDHELTTTNPNCAKKQNYKFLIPKFPQKLKSPTKITKKMQEIGIALNGVVIAGPYDSKNKIAPYNRVVDLCSSHSDPHGMYHYHFTPLCMKTNDGNTPALDEKKQIGWSFDGYKIMGLANRVTHLPEIDVCNGHNHDGTYHYHATRDFPFFMGCYRGKPYASNFKQKARGNVGLKGSKGGLKARCPKEVRLKGIGGKKRLKFKKAVEELKISKENLKEALGPPPGNFADAAKKLGISEKKLKNALGVK